MAEVSALDFLRHVVEVSQAVSFQAGVGGMETAGGIVSYLAKHPDKLEAFMTEGFFALPVDMHQHGILSWHGMNGKIVSPDYARRARVIKQLGTPHPNGGR